MRLATVSVAGRHVLGVVDGDCVLDLPSCWEEMYGGHPGRPRNLIALLAADDGLDQVRRALDFAADRRDQLPAAARPIRHPMSQVAWRAPVHRPTKVLGVGMNYHSFVTALGEVPPDCPTLFHKTSSALTGAEQPIIVPPNTRQAVPEGELAVVIGCRGAFIPPADVPTHIAGYACANDISARNLEFRTSQWTNGKMLATFCPLGPTLVTPDEVDRPDALAVETFVNGRRVQSGSTADMIFDVAYLIAKISELVTLEVGDVILTGTPSDLGAEDPPTFLQDGDIVTVRVGSLGELRNPVQWWDGAPRASPFGG